MCEVKVQRQKIHLKKGDKDIQITGDKKKESRDK